MRDITLGITFYHKFTTRAFATGIPGTLGGSPVLSVLEDNNATPITAGVSVSVDRATVTGLNEATIVATGGNGYEAGKSYAIYISTGTVGGVSVVGEIVGEFTVGQSAAAVSVAAMIDGNNRVDVGSWLGTAVTLSTGNQPDVNVDRIDDVAVSTVATDGKLHARNDEGGTIQAAVDAALVDIAADIIALKAETVLIVADTDELQTDDIPTAIAALPDAAAINAQVADVIKTDTKGEPAQGAPGATLSLEDKIAWLYKFLRNKSTNDGTNIKVYNDAGAVVDHKIPVSEAAGTVTRGKIATGP